MYKTSLVTCVAIGVLAGCSTQSGPTYTSHIVSTAGMENVYRVTCTGLFESSRSCVSAAQAICRDKPVDFTQIVDGNHGLKPREDPRELTFRCGLPPAPPPPPEPPPPPPAPAAQVVAPVRQAVVLFDNDSSRLTREAQARLDQFVVANQQVSIDRATVAGYTDSTGPGAGNGPLSQARADTVARYLQSHGLKVQQMVVRGFSSARPVESNATEEGRAQNRRAEVNLETN